VTGEILSQDNHRQPVAPGKRQEGEKNSTKTRKEFLEGPVSSRKNSGKREIIPERDVGKNRKHMGRGPPRTKMPIKPCKLKLF